MKAAPCRGPFAIIRRTTRSKAEFPVGAFLCPRRSRVGSCLRASIWARPCGNISRLIRIRKGETLNLLVPPSLSFRLPMRLPVQAIVMRAEIHVGSFRGKSINACRENSEMTVGNQASWTNAVPGMFTFGRGRSKRATVNRIPSNRMSCPHVTAAAMRESAMNVQASNAIPNATNGCRA